MGKRLKRAADEEINAILPRLSERDRIVCKIAIETGLRISDILNLPSELSTQMTVVEAKTKKPRKVSISTELLAEASRYAMKHGEDKLFKVSRSTIHRNVKRIAEELGMERIGVHSFRKTYAYRYYIEHGLEATRRELNHEYISTTMLYVFDDIELEAMTRWTSEKHR